MGDSHAADREEITNHQSSIINVAGVGWVLNPRERAERGKTVFDTDLRSPASGCALGRHQKSLTRRHRATENVGLRVVLASVSLRLCVRCNSLCSMDLYDGPGIIWKSFSVVAS